MCEPASPVRTTSRRRVGDAGPSAAAFNGSATAGGGGRVYGGGAGPAPGSGGDGPAVAVVAAAAGFPVHVSCMAISGGVIATAAGDAWICSLVVYIICTSYFLSRVIALFS